MLRSLSRGMCSPPLLDLLLAMDGEELREARTADSQAHMSSVLPYAKTVIDLHFGKCGVKSL